MTIGKLVGKVAGGENSMCANNVKYRIRRVSFSDLSARSKNKALSLFARIKGELKKGYRLKDIGLNAGIWDDVNLNEFMKMPKEHYFQLIQSKSRVNPSGQNLKKWINALYALLGEE